MKPKLHGDVDTGPGQKNFEELVLSTVVRVLREIFGEAGASFIYSYLRRSVGLEKERIPREIEKFRTEIMGMLGCGGLVVLNRNVEELAAELGVEAPRDVELRFEDKLNILGESYSEITASLSRARTATDGL